MNIIKILAAIAIVSFIAVALGALVLNSTPVTVIASIVFASSISCLIPATLDLPLPATRAN